MSLGDCYALFSPGEVPPLGKRIEGVAYPTSVNVEYDGPNRQRRKASLRGREVEALEVMEALKALRAPLDERS